MHGGTRERRPKKGMRRVDLSTSGHRCACYFVKRRREEKGIFARKGISRIEYFVVRAPLRVPSFSDPIPISLRIPIKPCRLALVRTRPPRSTRWLPNGRRLTFQTLPGRRAVCNVALQYSLCNSQRCVIASPLVPFSFNRQAPLRLTELRDLLQRSSAD